MKSANGSYRWALLIPALLLLATTVAAETRYVSDYLIVTVRSGKGNEYRILETIPTGTQVEVIEEDQNYVKVITPKGTEGYIRKHYVTTDIPKATQIKQLQQQLAELREKMAQTQQAAQTKLQAADQQQQQVANLEAELQQTRQELQTVQAEYQDLRSKSANVVNLASENEQLIEQNNQLNSELLVLREENRNFHRSNMIRWFLAGAGVFFGGWLIGKISRKKTSGFSRY